LDEQHKELVKMINYLIENKDARANSEPIAEVLDRMTRYAAYHFQTVKNGPEAVHAEQYP
jgi:hemerythrin